LSFTTSWVLPLARCEGKRGRGRGRERKGGERERKGGEREGEERGRVAVKSEHCIVFLQQVGLHWRGGKGTEGEREKGV
jgi:hypothetical protein